MGDTRGELIDILDEVIGDLACGSCYGTPTKEIAGKAADALLKSGWTPPLKPLPPEEWRVIPGFEFFEASNRGFIRHGLTKEWLPMSQTQGEPIMVTLHNNSGWDVTLDLEAVVELAWPTGQTEILFDNGNVAIIPDAVLTGESKVVETREEEWRDIDCVVGLHSFEIERGGTIRHKKTKRVQDPKYDEQRNVWAVELILNGRPIKLVGEALAAAMWDN
ncbi:hypothetical protein PBI_SPORTO_75 [Arthrobacter phage Sporto]|nr:hypothetical protein PBI_SPORTO_75 [Arthrobacter phage Sporto]